MIEVLEKRLARLRMVRFETEMSDDFCYTNGKIKRIDAEISMVEAQLKAARMGEAA